MKLDTYKVTVGFELATLANYHDATKLVGTLNMLIHDTLKMWAKDERVIVSPTRTTIERSNEGEDQ